MMVFESQMALANFVERVIVKNSKTCVSGMSRRLPIIKEGIIFSGLEGSLFIIIMVVNFQIPCQIMCEIMGL